VVSRSVFKKLIYEESRHIAGPKSNYPVSNPQVQHAEKPFVVKMVEDPLHMKRAMLMAKDYDLIAFSSPTTTTK
jgi:hypothetical protein